LYSDKIAGLRAEALGVDELAALIQKVLDRRSAKDPSN
jgi:hypothetical protein